jgi:transcriptional regulator
VAEEREGPAAPDNQSERNLRVAEMRDAGASWQEIARAFDLTRQQARYAYQVAKREERRKARREGR